MTLDHSEDKTTSLLDQIHEGSDSATRELFDSHRKRLRRMIAIRLDRRIAARLDPSDVVQDVLTEAFTKLPTYVRVRPLPFYPWLRGLAWRQLIRLHEHHIQTQKRSVDREARQSPELSDESVMQLADCFATSTPSRILQKEEMRQRVRDALNNLSDDDRELLILKHLERLTLSEIATVLDLTTPAVKGRHVRALQRFSRRLREQGVLT